MSIMDIIGKKKSTTLDLLNVSRLHDDILYTADNRKIGYILVEPVNMSVVSSLLTAGRVDALKNVIISTGTIEIIVLNSYQDYDSNRAYFDKLIKSEKNEQLKKLDELDRWYFDDLKEEMATSREFLLAVSFPMSESDESVKSELNKVRMFLFENQFDAHVASNTELKRLFAIYFESANCTKLCNFDGEEYIETED